MQSRQRAKVNIRGDPRDRGGQTDGHHQPRQDGLGSTVLGRTDRWTQSRQRGKVNAQGDPRDWGGWTDGHHQPCPDGLGSTVKELQ